MSGKFVIENQILFAQEAVMYVHNKKFAESL